MKVDLTLSVPILQTPRVQQVCGMFDVPPAKRSERTWCAELPLDERPWQIGLIHGPSGCGKTSIARKLWPQQLDRQCTWSAKKAVVDDFPPGMPVKEIVGLLSSVGFSSPPSWLRPFHALSNGEQFRVTLARLLAECPDLAVVDEFTSIVDRAVARIGSAALAKTVRRGSGKFVAVSCHDDIVEWLDPDWTFAPANGQFDWRLERRGGSRRGRPPITLQVARCDRDVWRQFGHHHYLSQALSKSARCYVAHVEGRPAAFASVIFFPHPRASAWREHRTVCLPDFQGVGIGNAVSELVAAAYAATGRRYMSVTSHPAMMRHRARSPLWRMHRKPSISPPPGTSQVSASLRLQRKAHAIDRVTAGFCYVGPANVEAARALGIV